MAMPSGWNPSGRSIRSGYVAAVLGLGRATSATLSASPSRVAVKGGGGSGIVSVVIGVSLPRQQPEWGHRSDGLDLTDVQTRRTAAGVQLLCADPPNDQPDEQPGERRVHGVVDVAGVPLDERVLGAEGRPSPTSTPFHTPLPAMVKRLNWRGASAARRPAARSGCVRRGSAGRRTPRPCRAARTSGRPGGSPRRRPAGSLLSSRTDRSWPSLAPSRVQAEGAEIGAEGRRQRSPAAATWCPGWSGIRPAATPPRWAAAGRRSPAGPGPRLPTPPARSSPARPSPAGRSARGGAWHASLASAEHGLIEKEIWPRRRSGRRRTRSRRAGPRPRRKRPRLKKRAKKQGRSKPSLVDNINAQKGSKSEGGGKKKKKSGAKS